ncbi:MAG: hypothetical protein B6U73_01720 [Desulfurococcales archaeon ex4484_204]|nr:MAG: hypothetical protein B6U73_01720 [Desulfurococcales archaeon ex4484_204]
MNVSKAPFKAVDGRVVTVVKKSSIWITLGVAAYVVVALLGIAAIAVGLYLGGELAAGLAGLGITILVVALIAVAALNFLRTKIDFEGVGVGIKTSKGGCVQEELLDSPSNGYLGNNSHNVLRLRRHTAIHSVRRGRQRYTYQHRSLQSS